VHHVGIFVWSTCPFVRLPQVTRASHCGLSCVKTGLSSETRTRQ